MRMPTQRRLSAVVSQLGGRTSSSGSGGASTCCARGHRTLSAGELAQFRSQGFVVVHGVFDDTDFADLEEELSRLVDGFAQEWCQQGLLSETHNGESFERRLAALLEELPSDIRAECQADAQLRLDSFVARQQAMFNFQVRNPKLAALATSLLGPNVSLSPLQHLRPHMGMPSAAAVYADLRDGEDGGRFWHQDQSVTMAEADDNEDGLTIWCGLTLITATEAAKSLNFGTLHADSTFAKRHTRTGFRW